MYIELTSLTTLVNPVNDPMPVIQKFYSQVNAVLNPSSFISSNGCYQKCLNKTAKNLASFGSYLGAYLAISLDVNIIYHTQTICDF